MKISETKDGMVMEVFVRLKSAKFKTVIANDKILVFCTEELLKVGSTKNS